MSKIKVSIVGASGYTGGELLRLLLFHPNVVIDQVTSERMEGKPVTKNHPNLRKMTSLKYSSLNELKETDLLFLCLPHGEAMKKIDRFRSFAGKIIDLSADFRLKNKDDYLTWYNSNHPSEGLLEKFVYGIPELHRDEMRSANYISGAGCNATASILALYPLFKENVVENHPVIEVKAGTSQAGTSFNASSHHPERSGAIRSYKPYGHRHIAEIKQELSRHFPVDVHLTATSLDMIRGIHCVAHTFLKDNLSEKDIWKIYRSVYKNETFIRIINEKSGFHRLPDPKILAGSNFCDIGFAKDEESKRLVVFSAIDNLMKGAAGQAVQAFNIMNGFEERCGLEFPGLHP